MNKTSIEWTDFTWNPVTGCNKVSQGCKNCYAETIAKRFWGQRKFTDVIMHQDRLHEPAKNKKKWAGKKVFVCSMSDLFHESVDFEFIRYVFNTFYYLPETTFQIVTKRPQRALEFFKSASPVLFSGDPFYSPPKNVWIGTSCEDQATADERIPLLIQIPAAVRFLSCEPLLGPINLVGINKVETHKQVIFTDALRGKMVSVDRDTCKQFSSEQGSINWVIVGGESGHGARPMHPEWVRSLRDQCENANVPFFFKQWGAFKPCDNEFYETEHKGILKGVAFVDRETMQRTEMVKVGKSKAGNYLDQVQHLNFPAKV